MDHTRVTEYLARLGTPRPAAPDLAALRTLQRAHPMAIPFENLSVRLGEPITLTEEALVAKVLDRRRGGYCYELNGAFAALLTALGYRVELLSGRVLARGGAGLPFDHLALRVWLDGEAWLVDVGFGQLSAEPLRLAERGEQQDAFGTFRITEHLPTGVSGTTTDPLPDLDVAQDGEVQFRLDQRPYQLTDFVPACWYQSTSPDSPFTGRTLCSRLTPQGRETLVGGVLIRTVDGEQTREELTTAEEQRSAYRELFGIELTLDEVKRLS
ncbi:arylamine N-acetyltransferase family protein [Kitasatospora viridis]|uniref:N-hydroxyarylamine O-acetyltransferase n=1 Tax=Kitasatospora viridis TaxID=281105 RepID=A0A561UA60_9ACTN|nr:arylamine N-acetyltransferase [Kitasatospora viridis]TWF96238.1 N-hydroxyarylamine O-acetyltransferase [Kitasatospora viridis]